MHPIVLVHGIANPNSLSWFTQLLNIPLPGPIETFPYFNGIAEHLASNGFDKILTLGIDFSAPPAKRAETLKDAIEPFLAETGAEKVHLIAHSMRPLLKHKGHKGKRFTARGKEETEAR